MAYLNWSDLALDDVARLARFLRPKSPAAARRAVNAIRRGARLIESYPEAGIPIEGLDVIYRELPVAFGNSGYFVYYRSDGDSVSILAVRHASEVGYQSPPSLKPS